MRPLLKLVLSLLAFLAMGSAAQAGPRVALVIGNGQYGESWDSLGNAPGDADLIAQRLRAAGFEANDVIEGINLNKDEMDRKIAAFIAKARGARLAVIYYTGHGFALDTMNLLVPVGAPEQSQIDRPMARVSTIDLDLLIDAASVANVGVILVDACRTNIGHGPNRRGGAAKGREQFGMLVDSEALPRGIIVQMASARGQPAYDGEGKHSPYAEAVARALQNPQARIQDLLSAIRLDVMRTPNIVQAPQIIFNELGPAAFLNLALTAPSDRGAGGTGGLDDPAWENARAIDTEEAYKSYRVLFGKTGAHVAEADVRLRLFVSPVSQIESNGSGSLSHEEKIARARQILKGIQSQDWRVGAPDQLATKIFSSTDAVTIRELMDQQEPHASLAYAMALYWGLGGATPDLAKAKQIMEENVEHGDPAGLFLLGEIYRLGDQVTVKDPVKSFQYMQKAADFGHPIAQYWVGIALLKGGEISIDRAKSFSYFQAAANQGESFAECSIGAAFLYGKSGINKDARLAFEYTRRSAEHGSYCGQVNLGHIYLYGDAGQKKDEALGAHYYRLAADQGYPVPQVGMGKIYETGIGVPKDPKAAGILYAAAADQGYADGQYELARSYMTGINGLPLDRQKARELLEKAAQQGHQDAKKWLAENPE